MESGIREEVKTLLDELDNSLVLGENGSEEGVLEVKNIFLFPVFKILWRMMSGRLTPEDEEILPSLLLKSQRWFETSSFGPNLPLLIPALKKLAPEWTNFREQTEFYAEGRAVATVIIIIKINQT
jgi:hypothetical protein